MTKNVNGHSDAVRITMNAARKQGLRADTFTVEELIEFLPSDGSVATFYESYGHVNGVEHFARTKMRRSDRGIECLGIWEGNKTESVVLVHPLSDVGRKIRVLTR